MTAALQAERRELVARDAELSRLRDDWREVCAGTPRLVLVAGAAGVGKTALTDAFLASVAGEAIVLRVSGEEGETPLQLGVLREILRAAARAGAGSAVAAGETAQIDGSAQTGESLLAVVQELSERAPVTLAIDDAHWADAPSLTSVLYALRRLARRRVLVVLVLRDSEDLWIPSGIRRLAGASAGRIIRVDPLDLDQFAAFTASLGVDLPAYAVRRLWEHTEGNPLYARAVIEELPGSALLDAEPLAVPRSYAALIARRLERCSPSARRLLESAAVVGPGGTIATLAAVAELDDALPVLGEGCASGLLTESAGAGTREVAFAHPLVRAAVYADIAPTRRAQLHVRAADMAGERVVALHHRAAAATQPDEALAAALEQCAREEGVRGWWASAGENLRLASRLSQTRGSRETRMLDALNAMIAAGQIERARRLAATLEEFGDTPMRDYILGWLAFLSASPHDAEPLLDRAWERCDPVAQPELATSIATRHAMHWHLRGEPEKAGLWALRALSIDGASPAAVAEARSLRAVALRCLGRFAEAREVLLPLQSGAGDAGTAVRAQLGALRLIEDDVEGAVEDLRAAAPAALRLGNLTMAAVAYTGLARAEYLAGEWDDAKAHAERAVEIVTTSEHPLAPFVWVAPVQIAAGRGDWAAVDEYVRLASSDPLRCLDRTLNMGLLAAIAARGRRRHDVVLDALRPFVENGRFAAVEEPGVWPWQDLQAEALVATGRFDEARGFLAHHEAIASARGRSSMLARLHRVAGQLHVAAVEPAAAQDAFESAARHAATLGMPYERALIALEHGAFQRARHEAAAEQQLSYARRVLAGLGARPALERCEHELQLLGAGVVHQRPAGARALTPAERRVALLVASGLTNREVAGDLLITTKSVEFHLTRVYAKLGVRSRSQLIARSAAVGGLDALVAEAAAR